MRFMKKACASLIALTMLLSIGTNVAAPPDHAEGTPPQKFYWLDEFGAPFTDTFFLASCESEGFDMMMTMTIQGFWMFHPQTPGKDNWEFYHSEYVSKIFRADDPAVYVEGKPGGKINRHWTAEPFASDFIETGVQIMITLPGYGVVFRNVGRVRFNWGTFDLAFISGHWDTFDEDYQALCAALS